MLAINQVLELNNLIKAALPGSPLYKLPPVVDEYAEQGMDPHCP
jgi:hypothetical protein